MTTAYVVKTGDQFLSTGEDGDIGLAPEIKEAKYFRSYEEAEETANRHADSGYEIVTVNIATR